MKAKYYRSLFNLLIATYILASMAIGGIEISIKTAILALVIVVVLTKSGEIGLIYCRLSCIKAWLPAAFTTGFATIASTMTALVFAFGMSPLSAFVSSALLVFALSRFNSAKINASPKYLQADIIIALAAMSVILFFSRLPISSPVVLENTGALPIWNDYFIHGSTIASLGSPFSLGGNIEFAGSDRGFYHYAPFVIPAIFLDFPETSGLALSTSMLLPMGFLIAVLGGYVFAVEMSGRTGGLLALTTLIFIPAHAALIQSGWFDFYWLMFTAPGSGYAIGVACMTCAIAGSYLHTGDRRTLILASLLLFGLILIRAHMFILLAPALIVTIIAGHGRIKPRGLFIFILVAAIFAALAIKSLPGANEFWLQTSKPHEYLNWTQDQMLFLGRKIEIYRIPFTTTAAQLVLILVAVLGIFSILYPITALMHARHHGASPLDLFPPLLFLCFVGLILLSPESKHGDISEYKHRHFLLLYAMTVIYTTSYACNLAVKYIGITLSQPLFIAAALIIFSASLTLGHRYNPSLPDMQTIPWAEKLHHQQITPGVIEASNYIAANSRRGDVFSMEVSLASETLTDSTIEVISLSGVPAYLSRPKLYLKGSECHRKVTLDRINNLAKMSTFNSWTEAKAHLQTIGVRWFLVSTRQKLPWDPGAHYPIFSNEWISVYDSGYSDGYRHAAQC